jgi:hypothetical protein
MYGIRIITAEGFELDENAEIVPVRWDEIQEIVAYKHAICGPTTKSALASVWPTNGTR